MKISHSLVIIATLLGLTSATTSSSLLDIIVASVTQANKDTLALRDAVAKFETRADLSHVARAAAVLIQGIEKSRALIGNTPGPLLDTAGVAHISSSVSHLYANSGALIEALKLRKPDIETHRVCALVRRQADAITASSTALIDDINTRVDDTNKAVAASVGNLIKDRLKAADAIYADCKDKASDDTESTTTITTILTKTSTRTIIPGATPSSSPKSTITTVAGGVSSSCAPVSATNDSSSSKSSSTGSRDGGGPVAVATASPDSDSIHSTCIVLGASTTPIYGSHSNNCETCTPIGGGGGVGNLDKGGSENNGNRVPGDNHPGGGGSKPISKFPDNHGSGGSGGPVNDDYDNHGSGGRGSQHPDDNDSIDQGAQVGTKHTDTENPGPGGSGRSGSGSGSGAGAVEKTPLVTSGAAANLVTTPTGVLVMAAVVAALAM